MIVDKNDLEKIDDMTGKCLKFRKAFWKTKVHITSLAYFIISSRLFDTISLLVIILNSI